MHKVEFESEITQGMIKVPDEYRDLESKRIRVIAIIDDDLSGRSTAEGQADEFRRIRILAQSHPVIIPEGVNIIDLPEKAANDIL